MGVLIFVLKKGLILQYTNTQTHTAMNTQEIKLTEILKKETETLKNQFLQFNEKYAEIEFYKIKNWINDYKENKIERLENQKKYYAIPAYLFLDKTPKNHIEKMVKNAKEHYEISIEKLAARIQKKGLNLDKLKTSTSHIGVNIETTLTDGNKTVRAFTIIAEGEIQRPHYRYLIK